MKKDALVQLILIYIGLAALYTAVNNLAQYIFSLFSSHSEYMDAYNFMLLVSYTTAGVLGFIIIATSGNLSSFIARKAGLSDSLTVYSTPRELLSIMLVVTALAHILTHLPVFIQKVVIFFSASHGTVNDVPIPDIGEKWLVSILNLLFPCLLIIFARNLTNYFTKNIVLTEEEIVAHNDTIEIEGDEKQV